MIWRRRRRETSTVASQDSNTERLASAVRELSVSQSKIADVDRLDERLSRLGVTPDEYGRALARGYLTRRSARLWTP